MNNDIKKLIPEKLGSIEFKAVLPPDLEDKLIIAINNWFPDTNYDLKTGMTKTTILFKDNRPYVIKIPHQGVYTPTVKCFDDIPTNFKYHKLKENYCEKELNLFINYAIPATIGGFFLPIFPTYLSLNPDVIVYLQTKAKMLEDMAEKDKIYFIPNSIKDLNKLDIPTYWLYKAIETYSVATCKKLLIFLNENPEISKDLSCENLGFVGDKYPVITDYAGIFDYY